MAQFHIVIPHFFVEVDGVFAAGGVAEERDDLVFPIAVDVLQLHGLAVGTSLCHGLGVPFRHDVIQLFLQRQVFPRQFGQAGQAVAAFNGAACQGQ